MNALKIFITLLTILTFSLNATAITVIVTNDASVEVKEVLGGPRTVIQAMADVIIEQPTATYLETTIVDSQGNSVLETETETVSTVISLEGLVQGTYTVETVDDNGDYQEFNIIVE
jgi:hypothetical protein